MGPKLSVSVRVLCGNVVVLFYGALARYPETSSG